MNDKGEQETAQHARKLIAQTLATIEPEKIMRVSASGSMGFKDWAEQNWTVPES